MPHLDLDKFLKEQQEDPLTITFAGRTFTAPNEIPIGALALAEELEGKELESADAQRLVPRVISMMLGEGAWTHMQANGIGLQSAMKVINALLDRLNSDEDASKAQDPKAQAARKVVESRSRSESPMPSASGDSSKQTSGGTIRLLQKNSTESESVVSEAI